MKVTLIAYTDADLSVMEESTGDVWQADYRASDVDSLAEFAGRACYQSWDKPNPKTRSNEDYLANVIGLGHESVLSHASATFYATGISRSLTHELIRHRWLSFSELSQRYVKPDDLKFILPPAMQGGDFDELARIYENGSKAVYKDLIGLLEGRGITGKRAREAARSVLPGGTETRIVVSGNLRAWRDFLKQRLSPQADAEIRLFAQEIHKNLVEIAPNSMIGITDDSVGEK